MAEKTELLKIATAVLLPNVGGAINGLVTRDSIDNWYEHLNHSPFRPPNWVFGPVWTTLYCGMGYASYLAYRDGGGFTGSAKLPLIAYATQLALNMAWTPLFFGQHNIKGVTFYKILIVFIYRT